MPAAKLRKRRSRSQPSRRKISTTVAPHTAEFFDQLIASGQADTLAEAIDHAVELLREQQLRQVLDAEVNAYYDSLSDEEVAEQKDWAELAGRAFFEVGEP